MLEHFSEAVLEKLPVKNLLQVGMDGPNVNWKFYSQLKDRLVAEYDTNLINLGSCGLHTVHNAFKAGAESTQWNISSFLSSLYYLFKDSPARRDDFSNVAGGLLPMKFVSHRWLENVPVSERALQIFENVKAYVKAVDEKKVSKPICKSYAVVSEMCKKDKLLIAKICFFKCIAMHLQPFLAKYQTSRPMVVFLSDDLCNIIKGLLRRIIKTSEMQSRTDDQLIRLDINDKKLHVGYKKVDVGFACDNALKETVNVSEREVMEFRMACKEFIVQVLKKLLTKSPVLYSVVRYLSCLNPVKMVSDREKCVTMFRKLLKHLKDAKRMTENDCEVCLQQYAAFIENIPQFGSERFTNFNSNHDRVDDLFHELTAGGVRDGEYSTLYKIIKMLLSLSHGQATVERGFSVNKKLEVENMSLNTLAAQRTICDHVSNVGGIDKVVLSKELLVAAKLSRQRYEAHLESEREKKKSIEGNNKRKRVLEELDTLKKKRARLEADIQSLGKSSDSLYEKAESTGKISFVTEANSLKRTAKAKKEELELIKGCLNERLEELKK